MKKFESIEEACLTILSENKDPWIPLNNLIQKVKEKIGEDNIDETSLIDFLKEHPEVKILDPFLSGMPEITKLLGENNVDFQPVVILKKRLPHEKDMFIWMYRHLENLLVLLQDMERNEQNETKKEKIGMVINKAKVLMQKLKDMMGRKKVEDN